MNVCRKINKLVNLQDEAALWTAHHLCEMSEGVAQLVVGQAAVELQLSRHSDHCHCHVSRYCVSLICVTIQHMVIQARGVLCSLGQDHSIQLQLMLLLLPKVCSAVNLKTIE